jgi:hypothetical protein
MPYGEANLVANEQQHVEAAEGLDPGRMAQITQNAAAIQLLHQWLDDESGYDECVWPQLKEAIEQDRLSDRKRFSD